MFKSIQWKVLTVFLLLIISVMLIVGTFLLNNVSNYYHMEFKNQMENMVFISDLVSQMQSKLTDDDPVAGIDELLSIYAGRIGIDSYRSCYVLDGKTGVALDSTVPVPVTQNILSAMNGQVGKAVDRSAEVMDYAYPLKQGSDIRYIVYVSDTKEELFGIMENIFTIIFGALLLGIGISIVLGLVLSRTIISPIISLKKRAEKIASGDFENKIDVKSADEIGQLSVSFNIMASDLKQTMAEIASEKNKVETIIRFMTDGVMAFDKEGKLILKNLAAEGLLAVADEEIEFNRFFSDLDVDIDFNSLLYLEHQKTVEKDFLLGDRHIKAYFAPLMPREGIAEGVVVVLQDITEQQKLEKSRREFVANVSHELRTPITTIKSYAETLEENAEEGSMERNFLEVINTEADRMTRLVKDLLTLSQLDYDKRVLNKTTFKFDKLVGDAVKRFDMEAKSRNHKLTYKTIGTPLPIIADRDRIEQVVLNLISNALKYTPDGGSVDVTCEYKFTDVFLTVADTGIGIPEADIPRIFERFYRVDKARSRKFGGTGLGLAIAHEIVEAHNGTIMITSKRNQGTKVTVKLPLCSD